MSVLILAVAFILGILIADLVGREDGADAEMALWIQEFDEIGDR